MDRNSSTPSLSVVIPTYRECENLEPLIVRLFASFPENSINTPKIEVIVVDDNSPDGTVAVMEQLQERFPAVRLIVRTHERGLSSAVLRGFEHTTGDILLVMDADLQHPPEFVKHLYRPFLEDENIQFVVGTREIPPNSSWSNTRKLISTFATSLSYPLTCGQMADPMTGFFALRRSKYNSYREAVSAVGYKIALELYVKCHCTPKETSEVTFPFGVRRAGESKLSARVVFQYLQHLAQLYLYSMGPLFALLLLIILLMISLYDLQKK